MTKQNPGLYQALESINQRPRPFAEYTSSVLWDDDHISQQMLAFHLDPDSEPASRPHGFIERSADWIISHFGLEPGRRVIDFGCGPGLYTERFAASGAAVTGVDISRRSINHAGGQAAAQGLDIDYIQADYCEGPALPKADLITLIYCDFCALSPARRQALLQYFSSLLNEGGSILLDVFSRSAMAPREESVSYGHRLMHGFWAPGDYWGFLNTMKYEDEAVVLDKYTIVEPGRTWTVFNWLQYFSQDDLARECAASGLKVTEWFGDVVGTPATETDELIAAVIRP